MTITQMSSVVMPEEVQRWLENRGFIYQMLGDFYGRVPALSRVAQWRSDRQMANAAELTEGGRALKRYLSDCDPSELPALCEAESEEYKRLMGELNRLKSGPREAAQLGREAAFCNVISDVYASAGIVFKKCGGEADDHIAIELEFMAVMHDRMLYNSFSARSAMELLEIQEKFLEEHLIKWVPLFCRRLNEATSSPLYLALSRMVEEFLPNDLNMLRAWKGSIEGSAAATV